MSTTDPGPDTLPRKSAAGAEPDAAAPSAAAGPQAGPAPRPAAPGRKFDRSIVEGPILPAVWKIAWPTMLQNVIGGLQGMVDHAMVGHFVGYTGNAAIGVSWQIFLVVIVFISSLYTGMGVLVARFAGAGDEEKVNRTVYQAFITSLAMSLGVLAPVGYFVTPSLLELVNAAPEVQAEALPYLRIMFLCSFGMLLFFMLGGALRSAGDARTPLRYGVVVTALNITLNVILIPGLGPLPALGTAGAAIGTVTATGSASIYALVALRRGRWVVAFPRGMSLRPDWAVIRSLFRFGLPSGIQGVAMNIGGVLMLRFIGSLQQSAEAQAAYAVAYTELFSLVTMMSVGLMGATAAVVGQNLGAARVDRATRAVAVASRIGLVGAGCIGLLFLTVPRVLLGVFGMTDPAVADLGVQLLHFLMVSGFFLTMALVYTGGLHGTGDTRSPLYISIISQVVVPLGLCFVFQQAWGLEPADIWLAILLGHITRGTLSVARFRQGKWRDIVVDIEPARA
ncbi:MAG TPA: MATE family efflux transporter [Longimicrobiales bacterium]